MCPARVRVAAFGPGQPVRDLFQSPDHAVYAEGVLIPVRMLVNGDSVVRHPVGVVKYWHLQVDEHDVLLAEGLPVESFRDTGKISAHGVASRIWEVAGCAPLHVTGPKVDAVRARLARALAGHAEPPPLRSVPTALAASSAGPELQPSVTRSARFLLHVSWIAGALAHSKPMG